MPIKAILTIKIVLAVMLHQPIWYQDAKETREQRIEAYTPVAIAIVAASHNNVETAAALISLGYHETKWANYVLDGRCLDGPRGARCDFDKKTHLPRARGPWQVWNWCHSAWREKDGSQEAITASAFCAVRHLYYALHTCQQIDDRENKWEGAFSGYKRGASCHWPPARSRVKTMLLVENMLYNELYRAA